MVIEDGKTLAVDFKEQASPEQFTYYYVIPDIGDSAHMTFVEHLVINPALEEVEEDYGIDVAQLNWGEIPEVDERIPYVLIGPVNPLDPSFESQKEYIKQLAQLPGAKVNLLTAFPYGYGDTEEYKAVTEIIPAIDEELGINTIFADSADGLYHGIRTVSPRDVADNIVCETLRTKYKAVRDSSLLPLLQEAQASTASTVSHISRVIRENNLWHRSRTDGAIAIRVKGGFLISQTVTDKTIMNESNFSLASSFDPDANTIIYEGEKIPSSDAPDFLVLLEEHFGHIEGNLILVHYHSNEMTRGGHLPNHVTRNVIEYGKFKSAKEIISEFERIYGDGLGVMINSGAGSWLILKEHGVVWVGRSTQDFENFVHRKALQIEEIKAVRRLRQY